MNPADIKVIYSSLNSLCGLAMTAKCITKGSGRRGIILSQQSHDVVDIPHAGCNARFHGRCNTESLVNSAEVVMNGVQGNRMAKVVHFLAESVRQPRKPAH